jgi:hypothetical protein
MEQHPEMDSIDGMNEVDLSLIKGTGGCLTWIRSWMNIPVPSSSSLTSEKIKETWGSVVQVNPHEGHPNISGSQAVTQNFGGMVELE